MVGAVQATIKRALESHHKQPLPTKGFTPAGVLLLHYQKAGEPHILLTKRTSRVEHHKGEISFPGGARDPEDATLLATALRETSEEVGVDPTDVEVLGELDDIATFSSRFIISPFVGTVSHPYLFKPSAIEIAEVLEVPVSALLDPANVRPDYPWGSPARPTFAYLYRDHVVWGATARILRQFLDLVYA